MTSINNNSGGLDVQGLVQGLMQYEKVSLNRLNKTKDTLAQQTKSFEGLATQLKALQNEFTNLSKLYNNSYFKASSSNSEQASITITDPALISSSTHDLQITQIAQPHKIASSAFDSRADALSINETLILKNADQETVASIEITTEDSLEAIRTKINQNASDSLKASILTTTNNGDNEYRLIIQTTATGSINQLELPNGETSELLGVNNPADSINVITSAQDATFNIDGFDVIRSSNTIDDVLEGLSLQLKSETANTTLSVESDTKKQQDGVLQSIKKTVKNYNEIIESIDNFQSFSTLKDSTYNFIKNRLHSAFTQMISSDPEERPAINSLFDLGLTLEPSEKRNNENGTEFVVSGKIALDEEKLKNWIQKDSQAVQHFFQTQDFFPESPEPLQGFSAFIDQTMSQLTESQGPILLREDTLSQQQARNNTQIENEQTRLKRVEATLTERFSKLDTLLTMQDQKLSWLTQQLEAIDNVMRKK